MSNPLTSLSDDALRILAAQYYEKTYTPKDIWEMFGAAVDMVDARNPTHEELRYNAQIVIEQTCYENLDREGLLNLLGD